MWNTQNHPADLQLPQDKAKLPVPTLSPEPALHPCLPVTPGSATTGAWGPWVDHASFHSLRFINHVIRLMIINACKGLYALQLEGDSEG